MAWMTDNENHEAFSAAAFEDALHFMMMQCQKDRATGERHFLRKSFRAGRLNVHLGSVPDMVWGAIGGGSASFILKYEKDEAGGFGWSAHEYATGGGVEKQGILAIMRWAVYSTVALGSCGGELQSMPACSCGEVSCNLPADLKAKIDEDACGVHAYSAGALEEAL